MEDTHTEFDTRDEFAAKRKDINSFDGLVEFIKDVKDNYKIGYGDEPRAIAQACLAVGWYLSREFGITGFQASFVMWDFIFGWQKTDNKTGLKLVDYDEMLYPQYSDKFEKTISPEVWKKLQEEASAQIQEHKNDPFLSPNVLRHWQSIVVGRIPFGYDIKE